MRRCRSSTASRGKVLRAEPVSALYEQGLVHHVGRFAVLEDQLCAFTTQGYRGEGSPDHADALVFAISELMLRTTQPLWNSIAARCEEQTDGGADAAVARAGPRPVGQIAGAGRHLGRPRPISGAYYGVGADGVVAVRKKMPRRCLAPALSVSLSTAPERCNPRHARAERHSDTRMWRPAFRGPDPRFLSRPAVNAPARRLPHPAARIPPAQRDARRRTWVIGSGSFRC